MEKSLLELVEETMPKITEPLTAVYDAFISNNRLHQTRALEAIDKINRGQIILPTGTGKTRIQVAMIVKDMIAQTLAGTLGTYVIASHRLLLNKQLMDELLDLCLKCGLPVNALYVGSARHDDKEVYDKYFQHNIGDFRVDYTTSGTEIRSFATQTKEANRHLIVVSTYHSFDSLDYLDSIDICAYDEAHNTTETNFHANILTVIHKIKRNYFFTATRKVCSEVPGYGMENESFYGKVIEIKDSSPTDMIKAGEILQPRIITMFLDNDTPKGVVSTSNQHMLVKTVTEGFTRSKEAVRINSSNPDAIGNKMIVSSEGSTELDTIHDSEEFQNWCSAKDVQVFSFSSKYGSNRAHMNFKELSRDEVYTAMKNLPDQKDAILLHIDILTEGIDLPAVTSILLLRFLNELSLFQTLGRGLRLTKNDRQGLYSGQITKEQFVKRHAYLILPLHFEEMDRFGEDMKKIIQDVVGTYGIPVEEFLPPEEFRAKLEKTDDGSVTDKKKKKIKMGKDYPLLSVIEDFIIGEVKKDLPKDPKGLYDALMGMFKRMGGKNA
jgi:superfamily II DNA or RNA helicase